MIFKNLIDENTDFSIINYCFKDKNTKLTDMQLEAVKETVLKEKVIWSVEQGLGKTYMSTALCNVLLPIIKKNKGKILVCVPFNKLEDFRKHLTNETFANVITTSGSASDVRSLKSNFSKADIILCTPSAWGSSLEFNCLIYNNIRNIYAMIYDEADGLKAKGYMHFIEVSKRFSKYVAMANATPLGSASHFTQGDKSELQVLYNLLYSIDKVDVPYNKFYREFTDFVKNDPNGMEIRKMNADRIMERYKDVFINMNRTDVDAITTFEPCNFHRVVASPEQKNALGNLTDGDIKTGILYRPSVCYKYNILPLQIGAIQKLWEIVNRIPRTNNIIIYAKNTDTLTLLKELFSVSAKIPTFIIDGQHTSSSSEKLEVEEKFNSTPGSIVLTNIEKGSNLGSAHNVIIYDAPSDALQYIFRGIRGSVSKQIQLDWIYYPEYDEFTMVNSLVQMKSIMDLLKRENPLYELMLQELKDVYPNNDRLERRNNT